MHRFFLFDTPLQRGQSVELAPIAKQLSNVLRAQPDDEITLLDGRGNASTARITALSKSYSAAQILDHYAVTTEPRTKLTLYQGALKADKFEWVLQKGTELGVSHFVPFVSIRTVVRPVNKVLRKYDRWRKIIQEAAEQSGRGLLPTLGDPLEFDAALGAATGMKFLPWEERAVDPDASLGSLLRPANVGTADPIDLSLLIGSEGGLEEAEIDAARASGWQICSLGPRILRAETAALAAISVTMDRLGEME